MAEVPADLPILIEQSVARLQALQADRFHHLTQARLIGERIDAELIRYDRLLALLEEAQT